MEGGRGTPAFFVFKFRDIAIHSTRWTVHRVATTSRQISSVHTVIHSGLLNAVGRELIVTQSAGSERAARAMRACPFDLDES